MPFAQVSATVWPALQRREPRPIVDVAVSSPETQPSGPLAQRRDSASIGTGVGCGALCWMSGQLVSGDGVACLEGEPAGCVRRDPVEFVVQCHEHLPTRVCTQCGEVVHD